MASWSWVVLERGGTGACIPGLRRGRNREERGPAWWTVSLEGQSGRLPGGAEFKTQIQGNKKAIVSSES